MFLSRHLTSNNVVSTSMRRKLGLVARKPVFGVSDNASFKPVSSASETSWKIEISLVISLDMMLFDKRITKALIRLRGCAGWSAPLLFANHQRQVFSRRGPNDVALTLTRCWFKVVCLLGLFHCIYKKLQQ